jgi:SAM-dependent methyltransferase
MAVESKPWNWTMNKSTWWNVPSEISYYLLDRWKAKGFSNFLDLGCGLGRHSLQFADAGFSVYSFDLSKEAVEGVREENKKRRLSIQVAIGDMKHLPYPDNSMDCLLAYHVISHTDSIGIKDIIAEIKRILKPQGEFYLSLCSKLSYSFKEAGFPQIDENTVIKQDADGVEDGVPHFYVDENNAIKLFSDFTIINLQHIKDIIIEGNPYVSYHYFLLGSKQ